MQPQLGQVRQLFPTDYTAAFGNPYCVTPDGQRFIFATLPESAPTPLVLVANWSTDLKNIVTVLVLNLDARIGKSITVPRSSDQSAATLARLRSCLAGHPIRIKSMLGSVAESIGRRKGAACEK